MESFDGKKLDPRTFYLASPSYIGDVHFGADSCVHKYDDDAIDDVCDFIRRMYENTPPEVAFVPTAKIEIRPVRLTIDAAEVVDGGDETSVEGIYSLDGEKRLG